MPIARLPALAAVMCGAMQVAACGAPADARPDHGPQARTALVAPMPAGDAALAPQAPFDERPITPFETVGASCDRTQC